MLQYHRYIIYYATVLYVLYYQQTTATVYTVYTIITYTHDALCSTILKQMLLLEVLSQQRHTKIRAWYMLHQNTSHEHKLGWRQGRV